MKRIIFTIISVAAFIPAFGWGQKGHDTVAHIARQHLTPVTEAALDSLLDGYSITYWANWLDNASHTPEYEYTKTWHYKNIDNGFTFEDAPLIPEGNIVEALYRNIATLNDSTTTKEERVLALKMVVHFLGDIHQPMHMGHATDRGGNGHEVYFFEHPTNLHSVWDTNLLESAHKWSHSEWQEELDVLDELRMAEILSEGNPTIWGKETYEICTNVYESTPVGSNIEYDYIAEWTPTIEMQLLKGGLRLADLLNSVFDSSYIPFNSVIKRR